MCVPPSRLIKLATYISLIVEDKKLGILPCKLFDDRSLYNIYRCMCVTKTCGKTLAGYSQYFKLTFSSESRRRYGSGHVIVRKIAWGGWWWWWRVLLVNNLRGAQPGSS